MFRGEEREMSTSVWYVIRYWRESSV